MSIASVDADAANAPAEVTAKLERRIPIPFPRWNQASRNSFLQQIKAEKYDLIHLHGGPFPFESHLPWRSPLHRLCLAGIPWILTDHCAPSLTEGLFPPKASGATKSLKTIVGWMSKCFLLGFCQNEIFASDENRGNIDRWFPWAAKKMRTIYNSGLDGAPPRPVFSSEVVTIANLGHIGWRKGQHDLLTAFAALHEKFPRLRLVLAGPETGDGCAEWVRQEIRRRKLESAVDLAGGLTDKSAFWQAADIYVQPSQFEGAPMALMEALWLGKPSVGTRVSGIPEMIQHDHNGLLVEWGKPAELAAAIERLIAEPDTRRRFGENAAAHIQAKGMTRPIMSSHYAQLYGAILSNRK